MNAPRIIDQEQPGFYQLRLVKNGAYVAARIFRECHCTVNGGADCAAHDWCESCDRFPPLRAEIDGEDAVPLLWCRVEGSGDQQHGGVVHQHDGRTEGLLHRGDRDLDFVGVGDVTGDVHDPEATGLRGRNVEGGDSGAGVTKRDRDRVPNAAAGSRDYAGESVDA